MQSNGFLHSPEFIILKSIYFVTQILKSQDSAEQIGKAM